MPFYDRFWWEFSQPPPVAKGGSSAGQGGGTSGGSQKSANRLMHSELGTTGGRREGPGGFQAGSGRGNGALDHDAHCWAALPPQRRGLPGDNGKSPPAARFFPRPAWCSRPYVPCSLPNITGVGKSWK